MGRLIDNNDVYNAIQIVTDNFGVAKHVVETNMLDMLAKIPTVEAIPKDRIKSLGKELRSVREGIKDEKVLIGFNMAVAICNKYLGEGK